MVDSCKRLIVHGMVPTKVPVWHKLDNIALHPRLAEPFNMVLLLACNPMLDIALV